MIVCLGGGTVERVKKSVSLYKKEYALKNKLLFIGENWYNMPYLRKNEPEIEYLRAFKMKNTYQEVQYILSYMREHHYKSALVVTDPPHSRRVKLLFSLLSDKNDLSIHLVSSDVKWWSRKYYYDDKTARNYAKWELLKMSYNIIKYIVADSVIKKG